MSAAALSNILPIGQAVLAGAVDSVENVAINIFDKLGIKFRSKDLDNPLADKVCIVTGGNAGIGYATAKKLAERGAHVVLACRSEQRGKQAEQELALTPPLPGCRPGSVEFAQLDLCNLKNVKAFAKRFNSTGKRLDVLICNAGIMSPATRLTSDDGLELQFQVNFLSHWLLAHELLAAQRQRRARAARKGRGCCDPGSSFSDGTRLVMLSSLTHHAGKLQWEDKQSAAGYSPFTSYALSKLCNTMMAREFQKRFDRHDSSRYGYDSAVAIHPGVVHTQLATGFFKQTGKSAMPWLQHLVEPLLNVLMPLALRTPDSSADSMLLATLAPADKVAGRYFHNNHLSRPNGDKPSTSPRKIKPQRMISAKVVRAGRDKSRSIADDVPAGTLIDGEYIIVYKPDVQDVAGATANVQAKAVSVAVAAMNADELASAASSGDLNSLVSVVSTTTTPEGIPGLAVIEVPSTLDLEAVRSSLMQSPDVEAVVPNRVVRITQADGACYSPSLASGVKARAAPGITFKWDGCLTDGTELGMFGERCGAEMSKFRWTGIFAYNTSNSQMVKNCLYLRSSETEAGLIQQFFGSCGSVPTNFVGIPTAACLEKAGGGGGGGAPPPASGSQLPTEPLMQGESTQNWGMARIGALSPSQTVVNPDAAIAATGMKVAVIDTGADSTHPDLNVVAFVDLVDSPGTTYYKRDGNGHGTHVSGIIGAKNQGQGVYGVVPGIPIVAIKVMDSSGSGPLDNVYRGYAEVLTRLKNGEKFASINLSLGSPIGDQQSQNVECGYINQIITYGTAVATAAGNDNGKYLGYNMPSACPNAIAVTSMTSSDSPSSFSNLAYSSSPAVVKAKTIAAPGSSIYSTYPGGYQTLSGTSMATPHVAGAFAKCALAGACQLSSSGGISAATTNYPKIFAAANAIPCGSSNSRCAPSWGSANYFGPMLNVRQW
eukprot:gene6867-7083_t